MSKKTNLTNNFFALPGYLLFFMMLFVPTTYQLVKAGLLVVVLSLILARSILKRTLKLHPSVFTWTFIITLTGILFMFRGAVNDTPGAIRVATIYFLWPWIYTLFIAAVTKIKIINGLMKVLVVATIAIGIYTLSYILHALGWLPAIFYIEIDQGQAIGFYQGVIEYRLYSISSLVFLVPFLMTALLVWSKKTVLPVSRTLVWIALVLGVVLTILSGRRALWLSISLSLCVSFSVYLFFNLKIKLQRRAVIITFIGLLSMLVATFVYVSSKFNLDLTALLDYLSQGFDFAGDKSANARSTQFFALLEGWFENPLLGAGHGAAASVIRSDEYPWAYELSYVALLFHTGLLGFTVYALGIVWIYWMSFKIIRTRHKIAFYIIPVLVGTTSFLIANATNPYLTKYDYLWIIFLPLGLINYWLLDTKRLLRTKYSSH